MTDETTHINGIHKNIIANYRFAYATKNDQPYLGTDERIAEIINFVGVLSTSKETDDAVLLEMEWDFSNVIM